MATKRLASPFALALFFTSLLVGPRAHADPVLKLMGILRIAPDYKQRMTAAMALARRKDKRAVPALIAALKDPHPMVRGVVAGVLGKLGDHRAIPALESLLSTAQEQFLRSQAKEALMALKRPATPPSGGPGSRVPGGRGPGSRVPGGDEMKMKASGTMGTLDQSSIQDEINARLPAATDCFNREFSRLQYLGGKIKLLFRVNTSGRVKWLMVERSTVGSLAVEACIVGVMKRARFDAPSGGEAEFGIPLAFGGGDPVMSLDGRSKEARRVRRSCRKLMRGTGRGAPAGLLVTIYVNPAGRISSAGLSAGGVELSSSFSNALVSNLKKLKLGRRAGYHRKLTLALNCS